MRFYRFCEILMIYLTKVPKRGMLLSMPYTKSFEGRFQLLRLVQVRKHRNRMI